MSPEEKQYIKDEVAKINEAYVRANFNIEKERKFDPHIKQSIDVLYELRERFSPHVHIRPNAIMDFLHKLLDNENDSPNVYVEFTSPGYEDTGQIYLRTVQYIAESDPYLIERLIRQTKQKLRQDLTNKFNAPFKKAKADLQRQKLEEKRRTEELKQLNEAKRLLIKNGYSVSGLE